MSHPTRPTSSRRTAIAIALAASIALPLATILDDAGCERVPPAHTPEAALEQFVAAAAKSDETAARRCLTAESVELMEKIERTARDIHATNVPRHVLAAFLARFRDEDPEIRGHDIHGARATLRVRYRSGHDARLELAREDGVWKLDLAPDLKPSLTLLDAAKERLAALARGDIIHDDDD